MVSDIDRARRALVSLLKSLAKIYDIVLDVTRESGDKDLRKAFRTVSRKTHPDHGGNAAHQKALNTARDEWVDALKATQRRGRPSAVLLPTVREKRSSPGFRIRALGVLLTYQKFTAASVWTRFVPFVKEHVVQWRVRFWSATMETNHDETFHLHLMLQFYRARDQTSQPFVFESVRPNGQPNDLLGEGWGGKRQQVSLDRGFFYVFADKEGTARSHGKVCVAGNYEPAWTRAKHTYAVRGEWLDRLWRAYKLSFDTYDAYLHLARDGVPYRKRNLEACRTRADELTHKEEVAERTKRLRSNPRVFQRYSPVREADAWLALFQEERLRYPLLLVHAPSFTGKTEWALSLFKCPLLVRVGPLKHFPEQMRKFDHKIHDGLILDDVRDLAFLSDNQDKVQGSYHTVVEFASTAGGTCAYFKDLYKVPVVVTVNNDTNNLDYLATHDFLSKKENVHFLSFSSRPGEAPPQTTWQAQ